MMFARFYRKPSIEVKVAEQLHEAELGLLDAELAKEHWDASCSKLRLRITRLRRYLADVEERRPKRMTESTD